jgi:hypothetical protein
MDETLVRAKTVFENEDMVTALGSIEVRTAAADAMPRVAAVLADAFVNDPVFTWLLPGSLRLQARLRTMFAAEMEQYVVPNGTVWTTSGYDGAVTELPPGAWEMPKSATGKEALKWMRAFGRRLALAGRVQRAMEERHLREPHFYVRTIGVRTALQGQGVDESMTPENIARLDQAMDDAGVCHTTELYEGAQHGCTMSDMGAYNEAAAERHFMALFALLQRAIPP